MLEEARTMGNLAKSGWHPRRTIIFAAWDGEEEGLLGSTEWVEAHVDELRNHAAVYINSDSNGRGFLEAGGSHTLERFVSAVVEDVVDPERNVSVFERLRAHDLVSATSDEDRKEAHDRTLIRLDALGSGSDYTPFLQFAGIASLSIGYGGEGGGGSYHSIYDSFDHYTRFGDPKFDYGIAQAKTTGRLVLRLANADVLPLEFTRFADAVARYTTELINLADKMRGETEEKNRQIRERTMEIAADPNKPFVVPREEPPVPHLELATLQNAVACLKESAAAYERAANRDSARSMAIDRALMRTEQALTRPEGLPGRPWYKHYVYAPGQYTGYGVKTLPAAREAIEQKKWEEANRQIAIVAKVLETYAAQIDRAAEIARGKSE